MAWVATATIGSALVGGVVASNAANRAASAQTDAANASNATQLQMYNQTRTDQTPWRDAGASALKQMTDPNSGFQKNFSMSDFQADPGYAFRMQQGQQAIERSAAARGGLNSGAAMKALNDYGQGQASQEFNNAYNRFNNNRDSAYNKLAGVAGVGQVATNQMSNANQNYANQYGNNMSSIGNANSAAAMAGSNAFNNMASQGMNTWMMSNMMNRNPSTTPSIPTYGNSAGQSNTNYGNYA